MELVSIYLYNRIPIVMNNISPETFHHLKRHGWYSDTRTNIKFTLLNKRIEVNGKWYRVLVRFEYNGVLDQKESYVLSLPCPFVITQCEPVESITSARWKDKKIFHGPKIGMTGYLKQGVPADVIQQVHDDLKTYVQYN